MPVGIEAACWALGVRSDSAPVGQQTGAWMQRTWQVIIGLLPFIQPAEDSRASQMRQRRRVDFRISLRIIYHVIISCSGQHGEHFTCILPLKLHLKNATAEGQRVALAILGWQG